MEDLGMREFWHGRRVFLTGHTGFKGGWLALWLKHMGANVHGFALAPSTHPNLFEVCGLEEQLDSSTIGDVRDISVLRAAMREAAPEVVFHLAAQPLVRESYDQPIDTFDINVMGTVNTLECTRDVDGIKGVVVVTTDKCYENLEVEIPYKETDRLGGRDPYSSSKACSELVANAYSLSFLSELGIGVATARAGNVIGGGDWAPDRLVPDLLRAHEQGETLQVRSPGAVRPWQHVLEPLSGYLLLGRLLCESNPRAVGAWNFGPAESDARPVSWVVERMCSQLPDAHWDHDVDTHPHEANLLMLDHTKVTDQLGWTPRWNLEMALDKTIAWEQARLMGANMLTITSEQISDYEASL